MNRNDLQKRMDKAENSVWKLHLLINRLKGTDKTKALAKNKQLRNRHKGETCFILGNGPSLKQETRLEELKDYCVFTVNQMYRSPIFQTVEPDYHVMMDPLFFQLREDDPAEADTLHRMQEVAAKPDVQMILPVDAKAWVDKNLGGEKHIYIKGRYRYFPGYNRGYDMAEYLPASHNVVQTAVYCALGMGFQKIVLLGCDMTGLLDNYVKRSPEMKETFSHVYEYTDAEKQRMQRVHAAHDNAFMLGGFYAMFQDFQVIAEQCREMGVEIFNASQTTAVDSLPYANLDEILDELRGSC